MYPLVMMETNGTPGHLFLLQWSTTLQKTSCWWWNMLSLASMIYLVLPLSLRLPLRPQRNVFTSQSPAAAGARMRFRGLLSQSAFPIRLNALWRRGLLHDKILRVDKWSSVSQTGPHCGGSGLGWGDRQLGAQEMKGAHSLTDVLIKNS